MLGDNALSIIDKSPDYILDKFSRYIMPSSHIYDTEDHKWGVHVSLELRVLERYHDAWGRMLGCTLKELLTTV